MPPHGDPDVIDDAIERARLYARSVEYGAVEERNRLALEVHDGLDKVGQGRHARFVTDVKKTEERLAAKGQKAREAGKLA